MIILALSVVGCAHKDIPIPMEREFDSPTAYLLDHFSVEDSGGNIDSHDGELEWNPNARVFSTPTPWRSIDMSVNWSGNMGKEWLKEQGFTRPDDEGNRNQLSSIEGVLANTYSRSITDQRLGTIVIQALFEDEAKAERMRLSFSQPVSPFERIEPGRAEQDSGGKVLPSASLQFPPTSP